MECPASTCSVRRSMPDRPPSVRYECRRAWKSAYSGPSGPSTAKGTLVVHWIDIATGAWGPTQEVMGGARRALAAPGKGNWAAAIVGKK